MKRKILWLLREANRSGDGWVIIDVMFDLVGYTYRNRISELRTQEGYDIIAVQDEHGWKYHLVEEKQMRMVI